MTLDAQQSRVSGLTQQHNALRENAPHSNELIGARGLNQELLNVESEVRFIVIMLSSVLINL